MEQCFSPVREHEEKERRERPPRWYDGAAGVDQDAASLLKFVQLTFVGCVQCVPAMVESVHANSSNTTTDSVVSRHVRDIFC